MKRLSFLGLLAMTFLTAMCQIPEDFPRFSAPGAENALKRLRELYWLHYPGAGPKSTLWDEWLPAPGLMPAIQTNNAAVSMRLQWNRALSQRIIDPEGYVATHQHPSIAHPLGWPFPFWTQGRGGFGWHFSFKETVDENWRPRQLNPPDAWRVSGVDSGGLGEDGWSLNVTGSTVLLQMPNAEIDTFQSPFIQLRWKARGLGACQPSLEWITPENPQFSPERRVYFEPYEGTEHFHHTVIPVYRHPQWKGKITGLRLRFDHAPAGSNLVLQALFSQYDTRHNVNGQAFIRGCAHYFWWTRDLQFLRQNINRMRLALRYLQTEHRGLSEKVICTDWVGHEGRTGLKRNPDGSKQLLYGEGVGNNYWDLLPFGDRDVYATIRYFEALRVMAQIEREVLEHPEWQMPVGVFAQKPADLTAHANEVKQMGNRLFWNPKTQRFAPIDREGKRHDYGYTFLNLEAVYYDFATPAHAKAILTWLCGDRTVAGDTAQGSDIYHWRFAPRASTRRNIDYYGWFWSNPESIPWGGQVQDGGAVLGFSFHDVMARLQVRGADDAWERLLSIVAWFEEVQAAGGYRNYYNGSREGTLQGGGTAGGLGMDQEFFESVMVPFALIEGFLGFRPTGDGFVLQPKLPRALPSLTVDSIHWHDQTLQVKVSETALEILKSAPVEEPCFIRLPAGRWSAALLHADGSETPITLVKRASDQAYRIDWRAAKGIRFKRL